jgi:hypothetical protein
MRRHVDHWYAMGITRVGGRPTDYKFQAMGRQRSSSPTYYTVIFPIT